jgi:hypothetical protein
MTSSYSLKRYTYFAAFDAVAMRGLRKGKLLMPILAGYGAGSGEAI